MTLDEMQREAWQVAHDKGFHEDMKRQDGRDSVMIRLALIHTEVSEACQAVKRHGLMASALGEELGDILIRVGDLAHIVGVSLDACVRRKMQVNRERPYKYGTPEEESKTHG